MRDLHEFELGLVSGAGRSPTPPSCDCSCPPPRTKNKGNNGYGNGGDDGVPGRSGRTGGGKAEDVVR